MYSDKHQESGFNIQVAASIGGDLAAVGDPIPGARRDTHAFTASVPSVRAAVERAISHLQKWKIPATQFRAPPEKFPATLRAVVGLYHLKWAYEETFW
jgi:hypothetical protein